MCGAAVVAARRFVANRAYSTSAKKMLKSMHLKSFWNERYSREKTNSFEWFGGYDVSGELLTATIRSVLQKRSSVNYGHCRHHISILDIGCGASELVPSLIKDFDDSSGFLTAVAIDFSDVATRQMLDKHVDLCTSGRLSLVDVDILERLPFIEASFDVVVDKGTLDAILHGYTQHTSFSLNIEREAMLRKVLTQIDGVVRPGGALFMVTDEPPEVRMDVLNAIFCGRNSGEDYPKTPWTVSCRAIYEGEYEYFVYECIKPSIHV
eukprot:m.94866 g.94866  ORF g.94866 m.94866 type:complete len:265 (-) comp16574_c0_seq2:271-1065(-)